MDTNTNVPVATDAADPSLAAVQQQVETPESQGTPEAQQADPFGEERSTYQTQLQERDQELQRLREAQARADKSLAEQAAKDWREAEVKVSEYAKQQDPDTAIKTMQTFYQQREQALIGHAQSIQQQAHVEKIHAYADYAIRELELSEADRSRLVMVGMQDPMAMQAEAERIKNEKATPNAELAAALKRIEQLERGQQAGAMRASGAWQTGSGMPQPVSTEIKPGSKEHLIELMRGSAGFPE